MTEEKTVTNISGKAYLKSRGLGSGISFTPKQVAQLLELYSKQQNEFLTVLLSTSRRAEKESFEEMDKQIQELKKHIEALQLVQKVYSEKQKQILRIILSKVNYDEAVNLSKENKIE